MSETDEIAQSIWQQMDDGQRRNFCRHSYAECMRIVRDVYKIDDTATVVDRVTETLYYQSRGLQ